MNWLRNLFTRRDRLTDRHAGAAGRALAAFGHENRRRTEAERYADFHNRLRADVARSKQESAQ